MPKPKKPTISKPPGSSGYASLVQQIQTELSELDFFVKRRTAESYWKVGRFIHEYILHNQDRAGYGEKVLERLEKDVNRDKTTLRKMLQFYRVYPIGARGRQLTWSHYRTLMSVEDKDERKKLEQQIIQKNWDAQKFQKYLTAKRELETPADEDKPIPRLKMTRGRLNTFAVIEPVAGAGVLLDLGFRVRAAFPSGKNMNLKAGDCVTTDELNVVPLFTKTSAKTDEIFTYKATIEKIIDGDTLLVLIGLGFGISIQQKLRLRALDCPEIDTDEGKQAKKFVQTRLQDLEFIVIKTYKDTTDKYDRYLADVFYSPTQDNPLVWNEEKVVAEGMYLNQELLDHKLAVAFE